MNGSCERGDRGLDVVIDERADLMGMQEQWWLRAAAGTDVGMLRDHNEDNLGMIEEQGLFVVADGMGGHAAGEVASQLAVETLLGYFQDRSVFLREPTPKTRKVRAIGAAPLVSDSVEAQEEEELAEQTGEGGEGGEGEDGALLEAGIKLANLRIFEMGSQDQDRKGMGTTIVAVKVCGGQAHLAHVGDSRIYLYRKGNLQHMTRDHSWFADLMASAHEFTPQTLAYAARYKNVITRALGMEAHVDVDLSCVEVERGDIFLLCSDGLHDMIEDDEIGAILGRAEPLEAKCEALIRAANEAGGDDNISVMLIEAAGPLTLRSEEEE